MSELSAQPSRFRINWTPVLCASVGVFLAFIALALKGTDTLLWISLFLVFPALIAITIVIGILIPFKRSRGKRLTLFVTIAALWAVSLLMFVFHGDYDFALRSRVRWLLWSHSYKTAVLAQQPQKNGDFRSIEWDGWGLAGMDTTAYLVFDPSDSLSEAAKSGRPGKFNGIPCVVPEVQRLEPKWYAVVFYTNQMWNGCQ